MSKLPHAAVYCMQRSHTYAMQDLALRCVRCVVKETGDFGIAR